MIGFGCTCVRNDFLTNDPFQVLERINDNAFKIDLPGEYGVSATFNVADLTLFDTNFDSRSNPFEEEGMMWTSPETPARTHYMFQMVQ